MARKKTVFAAIALVVLAVIGTTVVMVQGTDKPPSNTEVVDLDQIREDTVRDLFNSAGSKLDPDQRLADIAEDHRGGFGGYYFHETDKSIVYVYMLDISQTAAAEDAFRAAYDGDHDIARIIPVRGNYSFDQLVRWFFILDRALIESGIHPSSGSARELENRIRIGLRDADQIEDALDIMRSLEIPEGAVVLEEEQIRLLTDEDNVKAKWRPLVG